MVWAVAVLVLFAAIPTPSANPAVPHNEASKECRTFRSKGCQMFLGVQVLDPSCDRFQVPFHIWSRLRADLCRFVAWSAHQQGQHANITPCRDAMWLGYVNSI